MNQPLLLLAIALVCCACAGPSPILYPNDHYQSVGEEAATADIDDCKNAAEEAGAEPSAGQTENMAKSTAVGAGVGAATGAVGGAVVGAAGSGSLIGLASGALGGLIRWMLSADEPSQAYVNFVNRCLSDQKYDVIGWE